MPFRPVVELSTLEFHVLLALAEGPRHGYAVKEAVEQESAGTLTPRAGSLYRVLARLLQHGWLKESDAPADAPPHPGLTRRYFALTREGRRVLLAEAGRLKRTAALAQKRLGTLGGR